MCVALCDHTMLAMQACVSDKSTGAGHTAMICFELVLATADAPYHTTIAPNNESHWVLLLLLLLPFLLLLLLMAQGVVAASLLASCVAIFRFEGRVRVNVCTCGHTLGGYKTLKRVPACSYLLITTQASTQLKNHTHAYTHIHTHTHTHTHKLHTH